MTLKLAIGGDDFVGWVSAKVDRGLDQFAHSFSLTYFDRWSSEAQPWPIVAEDACVLSWDGELMIDGIVDRPVQKITGDTWTLNAAGRSRTGQLVDCSAIHETGHWNSKGALAIVSDLCEPYGIKVSTNVASVSALGAPQTTDPFPRFAIREGETVFNAIDRICKIRALLPRTVAGGLELFTSDLPGPVLTLDVDSAIERTHTDDSSKRHSEYLVRATGVVDRADAFVQAKAADTGVSLFRPLVVVGDAPARTKQAEQRAIWEANVRSGRGESLTYTFMGVHNLIGRLYAPAQRYRVKDLHFGVDTVLMVKHVTVSMAPKNLTTKITLVHPEAYSRFPYDPKRLVKRTRKPKRTKRGSL